jgi:anti-sigma-K factor RskA
MDSSWTAIVEEVYGTVKSDSEKTCDLHLQAGEYVLGTLQGIARKHFERTLQRDLNLQAEVDAWERRLSSLLDDVEAIDPPYRVWRAIEQRIDTKQGENSLMKLWNNLHVWRGLGMVAASLMLVLIFNNPQKVTAKPDRVLVVSNSQERPAWVITKHQGHDYLRVSALENTPLPQGRYCLLWMEDNRGRVIPVGILPHRGTQQLSLPESIEATTNFKVSIESGGDAEIKQPSSDVIYEGRMRRI